jgi:hypothetical protein
MAALEIEDVPQEVRFPSEEEKILAYWDDIDAFKTSLKCGLPHRVQSSGAGVVLRTPVQDLSPVPKTCCLRASVTVNAQHGLFLGRCPACDFFGESLQPSHAAPQCSQQQRILSSLLQPALMGEADMQDV